MKILKKEKFYEIEKVATATANLYNGSRIRKEKLIEILLDLINKHSKINYDFKFEKNKKYNFLIKENENLGSGKYSKWVKTYDYKFFKVFEKETDCYYVFENYKVKKDNLICIIK